ncbi:MAG: DUF1272 domain-containing protein [Burkholderiales bacterium]
MLQLRPNCEYCNKVLAPDSTKARIYLFECTFCAECAEKTLHGVCPHCGGELMVRPRRPQNKLEKFPASTESVFNPKLKMS